MKNKNLSQFPKSNKKRWLILATVFLLLIAALVGLIFSFETAHAEKIYPKVKVGYLDLSNKTKAEALDELKKIEQTIQEKGLLFKSPEKEMSFNPIVISTTDPDLAKPVLTFNWEETVNWAYAAGRSGNLFQNLVAQAKILILGKKIPVIYNLNQEELFAALKASFSGLEKPPANAKLKIDGKNFEVIGEQSGYIFDYQKAIEQLVRQIDNLNFEPIQLDLQFTEPEIKKESTSSAVNNVEKILSIDSLKLVYDGKSWEIKQSDFIDWLEFQMLDKEVVIGLNQDKVFEFLSPIADKVNIEAQDAKFEMKDNRVTKFQASQDGKALNLEESYKRINNQIVTGDSDNIELVVAVSVAKITTGSVNDLGIKELIGVGVSNFAGSPKNRRHNIATGAAALNGILIEPDEEFSLLKALGEIDGEHGYKQELVIKGDRTIPEYGGGLCQIGTTTFRAALRSGLPITMRRNHSYRVVYYEPAGMDATIYNPAPDMKFINDTGAHILFTTRIVGDELIFEFFGTKDGRQIVIDPDPPSIYNVTSPGEPRYVETEELAPGEKKKIESAHKGADTYFKYTVTYPNGEVKETDFASHYVAWPEVWLVGRTATTTAEITVEGIDPSSVPSGQ